MPLVEGPNVEKYIKATRVYVSSSEDQAGANPDNLLVKLKTPLRDPIAIECTGYNIPNNVASPFTEGKNDMVDFYLEDVDTGEYRIKSFQMPQITYLYSNTFDITVSFINFIEQKMTAIIEADDYFGYDTLFNPQVSVFDRSADDPPDFRLETNLDTFDDFDGFRWGFLFKTGPNANRSAYKNMGFEQLDYDAFFDSSVGGGWTVLSPYNAILKPYRYMDIVVEEASELQPMTRINFFDVSFLNNQNEFNASRVRLLRNQVPKELRTLEIKARFDKGDPVPNSPAYNLEFTIYSLSTEVSIPTYLTKDYFSI